jgi:hypothetical protein
VYVKDQIDLRPIVIYLSMRDMNAREIYTDMGDTLGVDRMSYSTLMKDLREKRVSKSMLDTDFEPKIEEENFIDDAIHGAVEECPFSSLCQIAKRMFIPMSTSRYHLAMSLGYRIKNIRWVSHSFSSS